LIADSIQAVGDLVEIDDDLQVHGYAEVDSYLTADSVHSSDDVVADENLYVGGYGTIKTYLEVDTIMGDDHDTVEVLNDFKVHGELIADSIQAVGGLVEIDDTLQVHGHAVIDDYLRADSVYSSDDVVANNNLYVGGHADIVDYVNTDSIYAGDDVVINATVFVDTITGEDHDTITVTNDFKVNGELIVDSLQAVGNSVEIDDSLIVHGDLTVDGTIYNHNISIDTIFAGDLGTVTDTIYAWDNFFVHGELIADSIQAVGDVVKIDDSLLVDGTVSADSFYSTNGAAIGGGLDVTDNIDGHNGLELHGGSLIMRTGCSGLTIEDGAGGATIYDGVDIYEGLTVNSGGADVYGGFSAYGGTDLYNGLTVHTGTVNIQVNSDFDADVNIDGNLTVGKSLTLPITTKSGTISDDEFTILATGNVTLPSASGRTGKIFVIKNVSGGSITVSVIAGGGNIDGSPTYTLSSNNYTIMVQSDGSNWYIISEKKTP